MSHNLGTTAPAAHDHELARTAAPTVESGPKRVRHHWTLTRTGLYLLLAALPLLAISAQVFGVVPMNTTGALVIIPLAAALAVLCVFAPHPIDRIVGHGLGWGMFACLVYDIFRLDTVYLLDLWGDFIPKMGTWLHAGSDTRTGAIVGYLWRYIGDGGGIGIGFFLIALALGLQHLSRRTVVLTSVAFAVFPVWAGLIATVALSPDGQQAMFPLTPTTLALSLIGHLIFGLVLGLGFLRARRSVGRHWPWSPLLPAARRAGRRTHPTIDSDGRPASRFRSAVRLPARAGRPRSAALMQACGECGATARDTEG
ncbi:MULTISPECIES: hypothetical protein [Rhodococcus]|nr:MULTISPECIES: hypothetical protein [Rhodococcus]MDV7245993.1 hypothetical protein [Rhodococcus oxybenzonivorans]MDV7277588.1 hypothetical protein [Rhodococcus oxybenzonivorans]MDV7337006.1 hypothetical protein [Rhodococcus oxybenzonivorans]MDV7347400.1 hypothetical protein [Rhodococcus oxybenzonivorans]MDV8030851.1 hypothetical protein [Rhodococcus sp. IEGM 27]